MTPWKSLVLIFAGISFSSAEPTLLVEERSISAGGGFGLNVSPCPSGNTACGVGCCPNSLTCNAVSISTNPVCCAESTQCSTALEATPVCADSAWTLWEGTAGEGNYFCCEDGLKGDINGDCVSNKTFLATSIRALSLLPSHTAVVSGAAAPPPVSSSAAGSSPVPSSAAASSPVPSSKAAASNSANPTGTGTSNAGGRTLSTSKSDLSAAAASATSTGGAMSLSIRPIAFGMQWSSVTPVITWLFAAWFL